MTKKNHDARNNVWEEIAESFSATRTRPWGCCIDFMKNQAPSSIIFDLACGNGRHLLPASDQFISVIGGDKSRNLLDIAQKTANMRDNITLLQLDAQALPLKKDTFDVILFIAALHNIAGKNNRIKTLQEIKRILKKDGEILIVVWRRWQPRWRKFFLKELFKIHPYLLHHKEFGDILVPWKADNKNLTRFYHLYSRRDLLKEIKEAGLKIKKQGAIKIASTKATDNHFVIATK